MREPPAPAALAAIALLLAGRGSAAAGRAARMPEPLLEESITDIDGEEAGEVEIDATGLLQPARSGGRGAYRTALEGEWRIFERLGLSAEAQLGAPLGSSAGHVFALRAGTSFALIHLGEAGFHLMAEAQARLLEQNATLAEEMGEPALPATFGVRSGLSRGPFTLRGYAGLGVGGESARTVPLRASLVPLLQLGRLGFGGVELVLDLARSAPALATPEILLGPAPLPLPLRIGLAIPIRLGPSAGEPRLGFLLRVIIEATD